ncbi:MAG: class I SAM-dependent methyltransferase [Burkholderiales bacterium]
MTCASKNIRDYANSMFRFEHLHEQWIQACTAYITHLFGSKVHGAVVVDYAFGRGNWSVAFQRAGARRVIAIDASEDNVRKFARYVEDQSLPQIEVVHGNVLEHPLPLRADVIWAYGILQHVQDANLFLARLSSMLRPRTGFVYLYAYDKDSLREWVVSTARQAIPVLGEEAFRELSYLFTPAARLRARDDLTAPVVTWYGQTQLRALLRDHGLYVARQDQDFASFQQGTSLFAEFSPHHFLCSQDPRSEMTFQETASPFGTDLALLRELTQALLSHHAGQEKVLERMAAGLLNTHFSPLDRKDARTALVNDYLFLLYCVMNASLPLNGLSVPARRIIQLGTDALSGKSRSENLLENDGFLAQYLVRNTIRI